MSNRWTHNLVEEIGYMHLAMRAPIFRRHGDVLPY